MVADIIAKKLFNLTEIMGLSKEDIEDMDMSEMIARHVILNYGEDIKKKL